VKNIYLKNKNEEKISNFINLHQYINFLISLYSSSWL